MPTEHDRIRIVGLCGSLRDESTTRAALELALAGAASLGAVCALIDIVDLDLPYCQTRDCGRHPAVIEMKARVSAAHGLIIGSPEYHGSLTGALKNALDLMGSDEFAGKVCGLIGTAGGSMGAAYTLADLRVILRHVHAWVIPPQVSIPRAKHAFDNGVLRDETVAARLRELGETTARFAYLHHGEAPRRALREWEAAARSQL